MTYQHSQTTFRHGMKSWMETAGTVLAPDLSNRQILEQSGTLFGVEKRQIAIQKTDGSYSKSPGHYATVRQDTEQVLGTVSPSYQITQNSDALSIIEAGGESLEVLAAGCLDSGKKAWFYAQVKNAETEIVKGDPSQAFVLLHLDHTGRGALECTFTSVRLVCTNQIGMLRRNAKKGDTIKIRHSGNIAAKVLQAERIVARSLTAHTTFGEEMRYLAGQPISETETETLLRILVPPPAKEKDPAKADKKRERVMHHILTGRGQDMRGVAGTRYGVLQGLSHFSTHVHDENKADAERRLRHAWFGGGEKIVQEGRELLLSPTALAA